MLNNKIYFGNLKDFSLVSKNIWKLDQKVPTVYQAD